MAVTTPMRERNSAKKSTLQSFAKNICKTLPQAIHAGKSNACGIMISLIWITSYMNDNSSEADAS